MAEDWSAEVGKLTDEQLLCQFRWVAKEWLSDARYAPLRSEILRRMSIPEDARQQLLVETKRAATWMSTAEEQRRRAESAEQQLAQKPFPICPKCGKKVVVDWEVHEEECEGASAGVAQDGWIKCSPKTMPHGWALVVCGGVVQRMAAMFTGVSWEWADESADDAPLEEVSHWRELPAPPEMLERMAK